MKKTVKLLVLFAACCGLGGSVAAASEAREIGFDLHSTVYDYGESIDKVVIDTTGLEIDEGSLTADMFHVQATGTASSTLDFTANLQTKKGCNMTLDITYAITMAKPLKLKSGEEITSAVFKQGNIVNGEIAKFNPGQACGLKYQLYTPANAEDGSLHPLIVWFHGGGESGYKGIVYNNSAQLKANRGALGLAGDEAQNIFGRAYVPAPQTPNEWSDSLEEARALIDEIVKSHHVNPDRIYVYGCSAGGYMTLDMAVHNPGLFAAAVAVCPAIDQANIDTYGEGRVITDEEILSIKDTPVWVVQAKNDTTVRYEESALRVYNLLKDYNGILTTYDNVNAGGVEYSGHEAWVYTALNMPEHNGEHVWQWTARQVR